MRQRAQCLAVATLDASNLVSVYLTHGIIALHIAISKTLLPHSLLLFRISSLFVRDSGTAAVCHLAVP